MTRLERFKERFLRASASHLLLKPIEPLSLNRILVQAALRLGIDLKKK